MNIIIVDDDEVIRRILVAYILSIEPDAEISEYESAEKALENVDGADKAVLDVFLPGSQTDGLEIARSMKEKNKDIDILFYSGLEDTENRKRILEVGKYLPKRTEPHAMREALASFLLG